MLFWYYYLGWFEHEVRGQGWDQGQELWSFFMLLGMLISVHTINFSCYSRNGSIFLGVCVNEKSLKTMAKHQLPASERSLLR